jgi:hypothetical protein
MSSTQENLKNGRWQSRQFIRMEIERRFLFLISVGDQCGQQIRNEVGQAAVARMLDLTNVLELIVDRLAQCALAQENLVEHRDQLVLHILLDLGDQLYPLSPEQFE